MTTRSESIRNGLDNAERLGAVRSWYRAAGRWVVEHRGFAPLGGSSFTTREVECFLMGVAARDVAPRLEVPLGTAAEEDEGRSAVLARRLGLPVDVVEEALALATGVDGSFAEALDAVEAQREADAEDPTLVELCAGCGESMVPGEDEIVFSPEWGGDVHDRCLPPGRGAPGPVCDNCGKELGVDGIGDWFVDPEGRFCDRGCRDAWLLQ